MKKCLLLALLLLFSTGCSGLMDNFLDATREEEEETPSSEVPTTKIDLRMTPGKVEASGGGTHSIRASVKYKDEYEVSGGGTHSMRVEIGKRSK